MKAFLIVLTFIFSHYSYSMCACERVSLELGLSKAEHVFRAEISSATNAKIRLKSLEIYKGNSFSEIELKGSCAPIFNPGEELVIYVKDPVLSSECDGFVRVKNEGLYQQFLKLKPKIGPSKK